MYSLKLHLTNGNSDKTSNGPVFETIIRRILLYQDIKLASVISVAILVSANQLKAIRSICIICDVNIKIIIILKILGLLKIDSSVSIMA